MARYLGVAPWELEEQSVYWQKQAELSELVERRVPEIAEKIAGQRRKVRGEADED